MKYFKCPSCGATIKKSNTYCEYCNTFIPDDEEKNQNNNNTGSDTEYYISNPFELNDQLFSTITKIVPIIFTVVTVLAILIILSTIISLFFWL